MIFDKIVYCFYHTGDFRFLISTNYNVYLLTKFCISLPAGYVLYVISLLHGCDRLVLSSDLLKPWGESHAGISSAGLDGGGGGGGTVEISVYVKHSPSRR